MVPCVGQIGLPPSGRDMDSSENHKTLHLFCSDPPRDPWSQEVVFTSGNMFDLLNALGTPAGVARKIGTSKESKLRIQHERNHLGTATSGYCQHTCKNCLCSHPPPHMINVKHITIREMHAPCAHRSCVFTGPSLEFLCIFRLQRTQWPKGVSIQQGRPPLHHPLPQEGRRGRRTLRYGRSD